MVREHLFKKTLSSDENFRWRGGEVSRLEAFSDGIFAITVTLLIIANASINVFYDVWMLVRDLPAFFLSFAMIMYAWYEHYIFFRRYGLGDGFTLFLNTMFLFLIMILAYPLKLLTTFLWYLIIGEPTKVLFELPAGAMTTLTESTQRAYMMYFYGAAIIGVFGTLLLMHINAFVRKKALELDRLERMTTLLAIIQHTVTVLIATASITVLALTDNPGISGIIYFLMPIIHIPLGIAFHVAMDKIKEQSLNPKNNQ